MAKASDFDPRVLKLFDGYVHGTVSRRQFIDQAAAFTVSGAAILASLSPDYARAQQVDPEDPSISVSYKKYASPRGGGEMRGYFARPAAIDHKLPGVVVVHENRGLNPYVEDVVRRLAVAGFIAFAPGPAVTSIIRVISDPASAALSHGTSGITRRNNWPNIMN